MEVRKYFGQNLSGNNYINEQREATFVTYDVGLGWHVLIPSFLPKESIKTLKQTDVVGNDKEEVVIMIIQLMTKYDNILEVTLDMADRGVDIGMFEYGIDCISADSVKKEVIVWLTQTDFVATTGELLWD
jgi:hypothetical protein